MIVVRWTAPASLVLEGTGDELNYAADELRDIPAGKWCAIMADTTADPDPRVETLSMVLVQESDAALRIEVNGREAALVGRGQALEALAEVLDRVARDGVVTRLEWHAGHPFLSAESVPLVVARRADE